MDKLWEVRKIECIFSYLFYLLGGVQSFHQVLREPEPSKKMLKLTDLFNELSPLYKGIIIHTCQIKYSQALLSR